MYEVKVEKSFSAAHHLLNYEGVCENQHGHNWKVEVYVKGETLDKSNILVDFKILKKELDEVLNYLDHKDINTLKEFENQSPSSEFMAKFIYEKINVRIKNFSNDAKVSKVAVWETPTSRATYYED